MKIARVSLSLLLLMTFLATSATSTSAETRVVIEQNQGNSVSVSTHCSGTDCSSKVEASVSQGQQQQHNTNTSGSTTLFFSSPFPSPDINGWRPRRPGMVWGWPMWRSGQQGQVRINWRLRDGTCHVRYSEADEESFKYQTSASCSEKGVTIGGLASGQKYKFQVRQDEDDWSRVIYLRAR